MTRAFALLGLFLAPVFLPTVGPGAGTYGGGGNVVASVTLDKQGRVTAVGTGTAFGGISADSPLGGNGTSGSHLTCSTCVTTSRSIATSTGLSGGGNLSADRTLTVDQTFSPTWTGTHTFNTNALVLGIGTLNSSVANGASAIGFKLNTSNSFSTSGASLLSVQNNSTEYLNLDKDGNLSLYPGAAHNASLYLGGKFAAGGRLVNLANTYNANDGAQIVIMAGDSSGTGIAAGGGGFIVQADGHMRVSSGLETTSATNGANGALCATASWYISIKKSDGTTAGKIPVCAP